MGSYSKLLRYKTKMNYFRKSEIRYLVLLTAGPGDPRIPTLPGLPGIPVFPGTP